MSLPAQPTEAQWDALRELANVAAGHAASALSRRLQGERLTFPPPQARAVSEPELTRWLGGAGAARVAAGLAVAGEVPGAVWLVLELADAEVLAARLLSSPHPSEPEVDAALSSVAAEAAEAALAAVQTLTGLVLQPAETLLRRCSAATLARHLCREPAMLVLEARLQAQAFSAEFLLLPEAGASAALLWALHV